MFLPFCLVKLQARLGLKKTSYFCLKYPIYFISVSLEKTRQNKFITRYSATSIYLDNKTESVKIK